MKKNYCDICKVPITTTRGTMNQISTYYISVTRAESGGNHTWMELCKECSDLLWWKLDVYIERFRQERRPGLLPKGIV